MFFKIDDFVETIEIMIKQKQKFEKCLKSSKQKSFDDFNELFKKNDIDSIIKNDQISFIKIIITTLSNVMTFKL